MKNNINYTKKSLRSLKWKEKNIDKFLEYQKKVSKKYRLNSKKEKIKKPYPNFLGLIRNLLSSKFYIYDYKIKTSDRISKTEFVIANKERVIKKLFDYDSFVVLELCKDILLRKWTGLKSKNLYNNGFKEFFNENIDMVYKRVNLTIYENKDKIKETKWHKTRKNNVIYKKNIYPKEILFTKPNYDFEGSLFSYIVLMYKKYEKFDKQINQKVNRIKETTNNLTPKTNMYCHKKEINNFLLKNGKIIKRDMNVVDNFLLRNKLTGVNLEIELYLATYFLNKEYNNKNIDKTI